MEIRSCVGRWSRTTPQAPALTDGNTILDHHSLDRRVSALAGELTSVGIGRGDVVAIALPLRIDAVVAVLGVLRAGAAFLPLDLTAPAARTERVLALARVRAVVGDRSTAVRGPVGCRHLAASDAVFTGSVEPPVGSADDPAYVLFTSGSTGEPKGIVVSDANLAHYLRHAQGYASDGHGACLATRLTFDLSLTCLFLPLLRGEPLRLVPDADVPALCRVLAGGDRLGILKLTPSHLRMLATAAPPGALADRVRTLVVGGEALYAEDLARWRAESPATVIVNEYGPTETTVGVCVFDATTRPAAGPVPIGQPIDGVGIDVVGDDGRPAPDGSPGELHVTGPTVARYLAPGPSTAFAEVDGVRRYRTGDVVVREHGELTYLGRRDDQVKLYGHRVELGEVDAALRTHPGVHDVAAVVVAGPALVAFVVLAPGRPDGVEDVLRVARELLAPAAVPEGVMLRAELPRTAHGKVDRAALASTLAETPADPVLSVPPTVTVREPVVEEDVPTDLSTAVAVVGFDCVFPGAPDADAFWELLVEGRDGVTTLDADRLRAAGVPAAEFTRDDYVPRAGVIDGIDLFDAEFFGLSPAEARLMDPQHRLLMHSVWRALEHAGRAAPADRRAAGQFAGVSANTYLYNHLLAHRDDLDLAGAELQLLMASEKDFAPSRVAYALGMEGPAIAVQTGCSTGLTGVHLAVQSLLVGEVTTTVVGAACIRVPHEAGQRHREGGVVSPRGECRAFDADADGCVQGNGVAAVVLRLLADARRDGDTVHAVIHGTAVNNDGRRKVGYAAPSVAGQRDVLRAAHRVAGVTPHGVGYVEAHGTGTALGDPVEAQALAEAFGENPGPVAVASVKTNIGHLDTVAGLAGLLKVVLSLAHGVIPPSRGLVTPNPRLPWQPGGFAVPTRPLPWPTDRPWAGVSAFSVGGANAHVVLSRGPRPGSAPDTGAEPECVVLSAAGPDDLRVAAHRLADRLEATPGLRLADVAYTLRVGRTARPYRGAWVASDLPTLVRLLRTDDGSRPHTADAATPAGLLAQRWLLGVDLAPEFAAEEPDGRRRVPLPGSPLRPVRHWAEPRSGPGATDLASDPASDPALAPASAPNGTPDPATQRGQQQVPLQVPRWHEEARPRGDIQPQRWLVLAPDGPFGTHLVAAAEARGNHVLRARPGTGFRRTGDAEVEVGPGAADHERLLAEAGPVDRVVHAWSGPDGVDDQEVAQWSPLRLARALARRHREHDVHLHVVVAGAFGFAGAPVVPWRAAALGPVLVLPQEVSGVSTGLVDLQDCDRAAADRVVREVEAGTGGVVALRGTGRYRRLLVPLPGPTGEPDPLPVGTWLVTGGSGGVGGELAAALADAGSTLVLVERPHPPAPTPEQVGHALDAALARKLARARPDLVHDDPELVDRLTELTVACVAGCLRELGVAMAAGDPADPADLAEHLGVVPELRRMLDFMIGCLRRAGLVDGPDTAFTGAAAPDRTLAHDRVVEWAPDLEPLLRFLARCVDALPAVLTGRRSAVEVLYPAGDATDMETAGRITMARSIGSQQVVVLADWVCDLAERAGRSARPLRVLEVGAGNGLLTDLVLQRLAARGLSVEYRATDLGQTFATKLAQRHAAVPEFRTAVLDAARPVGEQGLDPGSFDVVLALNVVHATEDVEATAAALRSALVPGGHLALVESVLFEPWVDLVAGLAPGWWFFDDTHRSGSPLLDVPGWERVLATAGFGSVVAVPGAGPTRARADCGLFVARVPGEATDAGASRQADLVRRLRDRGAAQVHVVTADLADPDAVAEAVAQAEALAGPIDGVLHCAARFRGGLLATVDEADQVADLAIKAQGADHLLRALRDRPPRRVVLCSSMNVHLGGEGQAAYAAANAVLAALAEQQDTGDRRAVAVDWGRWYGVGHAARIEAAHRAIGRGDLPPGLTVADGLAALRAALDSGLTQVAVPGPPPPSARPLVGTAVVEAAAVRQRPSGTAQVLLRLCRDAVGHEVGLGDRLSDVGADSIVVLQLQAEIETVLGVHIMTPALLGQTLTQLLTACADPAGHPGTVRALSRDSEGVGS